MNFILFFYFGESGVSKGEHQVLNLRHMLHEKWGVEKAFDEFIQITHPKKFNVLSCVKLQNKTKKIKMKINK